MIGSSGRVRAYAYTSPVDMRKGFDGLFSLVKKSLHRDPLSGDLFLFVNRTRKRAKVLLWDGTGLCLYAKRLEKGKFACLWRDDGRESLDLSVTELQLFMEGGSLVGRVSLTPAPLELSRSFQTR